jgi:hypothetical protein
VPNLGTPYEGLCGMDEKPPPVADLDDDETADSAAASGPLGRLVEQEIRPGTVESDDDSPKTETPSQRSTATIEYAAGTTEHDDDREG